MVRIILILITLTTVFSCNKNSNPKKYDCLKKDMNFWGSYNNNSNLKLDGYYYVRSVDSLNYPNSYRVIILYDNGIIYNAGCQKKDTNDLSSQLTIDTKKETNNDGVWGAFIIVDNNIQYQMLAPISDRPIRGCIDVVSFEAEIINDSTINEYDKDYHTTYTYHFKKMYPKPDSTNLFMSILGNP